MVTTLPFTGLAPLEVFAVSDVGAQLTWRGLPAGPVRAYAEALDATPPTQASHKRVDANLFNANGVDAKQLGENGWVGAGEITGLRPDTRYRIAVTAGEHPVGALTVTTQPALSGDPLVRFATIGDLHLGETGFGLLKQIRHPDESTPFRCAKAAAHEAREWGAELLVIKGDITHNGVEWELFDELLADINMPILAIPGNHDVFGPLDGAAELRRRNLFPHPVHWQDQGSTRVVAVDSTVPGHNSGRIAPRLKDLCEAIDTGSPVLVFTHHHFQDSTIPRFLPFGVKHREGTPLLNRLLEVNPNLIISSGHTHRNRIRTFGTALITEVSSTKDYPGVWAGYEVHAEGVRQVVRRVADPACIAWTDRSSSAVGGIWGRWSPGSLRHRCHVHYWAETNI